MDYENFKESFTEALQEDLYGKGIEARFDMKSVEKLNNEGYDAVTVTPADSNIGVTLNVEAFYKAHESGASMDEVVSKASDTVIRGFDNQPSIDVASLMDYEQMKDKCFLQALFGQSCKIFLDIVACPNWTKLQRGDWIQPPAIADII